MKSPGTLHVLLLLLTTLFLSAGCGGGEEPPELVAATGRVTHDGNPVTAGSIIFHPASGNAYVKDAPSSLLQLDGSFTMKTFPFGEGVSPGRYRVTLAPEVASRLQRSNYATPDATPWSVEVPVTGLEEHEFVVE